MATFYETGSPQTFTVPAGVDSLSLTVDGAAGGNGGGGFGGQESGTIPVSPGDTLTLVVGGTGASPTSPPHTCAQSYSASQGGYGGGGASGPGGQNCGNSAGGGGGGGSFVFGPTGALLLAAGGGGGEGGTQGPPSGYCGGAGGSGGGTAGGTDASAYSCDPTSGNVGQGGTGASGSGAGQGSAPYNGSGTFGTSFGCSVTTTSGDGGTGPASSPQALGDGGGGGMATAGSDCNSYAGSGEGGGGGGGGYYGGGGGAGDIPAAAGGGGGSGYAAPSVTQAQSQEGVAVGNGSITVTFVPSSGPQVSISDAGSVAEPASGSVDATFTISLSQALGSAVSVDYATADGTGPTAATTAANDYTATSGTATIPAGGNSTQSTVPVDAGSGRSTTATKYFTVSLSNASGAPIDPGAATADGVIQLPQITGEVTDTSNPPNAVPGVQVTLSGSADTGQQVTRTTTTDSGGLYRFNLDPGTYTVTAQPQANQPPNEFANGRCDGTPSQDKTGLSHCQISLAPGATDIADFGQPVDPQSENLEISQGIQFGDTWDTPIGSITVPGVTGAVKAAAYTGTTLTAGQTTIVRLYASDRFAPTAKFVPAQLLGFRDSNGSLTPLPGSPISPLNGTRDLSLGPVPASARLTPGDAYNFELPATWTSGNVVLVGDVDPHQVFPDCAGCRDNDHFALTSLSFKTVHPLVIRPLAIVGPGVRPVTDAEVRRAFNTFAYQLPLGGQPVRILPIAGQIDFTPLFRQVQRAMAREITRPPLTIQDCGSVGNANEQRNCWDEAGRDITFQLDSLVQQYVAHNPARGEITAALWNTADYPPVLSGFNGMACGIPANCLWAESDPQVVLHELGHDFGLFHNGCVDPSVPWPPDNLGLMDGIGLDPRRGSAFTLLAPNQWFDPMTYCSQHYGHRHLSPWNWNAVAARLQSSSWPPAANVIPPSPKTPHATAAAVAAAAGGGPELMVISTSVGGHTTLSVSSASGALTPRLPGSPYAIVLRGRSGRVLSRTPVALEHAHGDGRTEPIPVSQIVAVVRDPGAARVQILDRGRVVEQLTARAFRLRVRFPRRVRGRVVRIAARTTGPGAGTARLSLLYAADGRHFRLVDYDVAGPTLTLPLAILRRSRHARVRVVADDGFRRITATSRRLAVP